MRACGVVAAGIVGLGWVVPAHAVLPDRVAAVVGDEGSAVTDLRTTPSGSVVVGVRGGGLVVLDTERWTVLTPSTQPCTVTTVAARDDGDTVEIAAGCDNATVHLYRWTAGALEGLRGGDGTSVEITTADGGDRSADEVGVLVWPEEDGSQRLFGLIEATTTTGTASGWEVFALAPSGDTYTQSTLATSLVLASTGMREVAVGRANGEAATQVVVQHEASRWSLWSPVGGTAITTLQQGGAGLLAVDSTDLAFRRLGGAWATTGDGRVAQWSGQATAGSVLVVETGLGTLDALLEFDHGTGEAVAYVEDDALVLQDAFGAATDLDVFDIAPAAGIVDLVQLRDGTLIGGTSDGGFAIVTAAPWVGELSLSPAAGLQGTEITYSFSSDSEGAWNLQFGGDVDQTEGDELLRGNVAAGDEVTGTFTVPGSAVEGANTVWAIVEDASNGLRGYAAATLTVDNPPNQVALATSDVGFADKRLVVTLNLLNDADITEYAIYVSEEPFEASDFATGGPETTIRNKDYPRIVQQPDTSDDTLAVTLKPLVNGTTYHIAIRATDEAGAEGAMSNIVTGTPSEAIGAAGRAGDPGGCTGEGTGGCAASGAGRVGVLGLLLGGVLTARRRRTPAALAAVLGAGLVVAPGVAHAQDSGGTRGPFASVMDKDETPAWVNVEASYGSFAFADDELQTVYGRQAGIFRLEIGAQLFRYAEIDFGIGLLSPKGNTLNTAGQSSVEEIRLQWLPMTMALTGRVHVLDEQPLVPYARIGMDMVWWRETPLDTDGKAVTSSRTTGMKRGWHWGAGGNILLDFLAPRRASMLEAKTGINDTWLFVEYRRQYVNAGGPYLDFSGWQVSAGLKLDY